MTSAPGGSAAAPHRQAMMGRSRSRAEKSPALSGVLELREHALVFLQHHIPPIIPPDVLAAIAAHRGPQVCVREQQLQTLHEFVAAGVIETRIAFDAVFD